MTLLTREQTVTATDGVARCARYAFGPNKLHLCGPDMNQEVLAYINAGVTDTGLSNILSNFNTLYPYLEQIAHANNIRDPFDHRVVEAYWIGNQLLDKVPPKQFYRHLKENIHLDKKTSHREFEYLQQKLRQGALMHHSFHVLNVWHEAGQAGTEHPLSSYDQCRISWAKVLTVNGPVLHVQRQPLTINQDGRLDLGPLKKEKIYRQLEASTLLDQIKADDIITVHWNVPCEIINAKQLLNLKKYTDLSIKLANQTI